MGIQGLLKGLHPFTAKGNIHEFSNKSLAVDASSWLHKSVYSISEQYVESAERSKTTLDRRSVRVSTNYMERRCKELFHRDNIGKIYLVFDGERCPLKAVTNNDREARRQKNLTEARMFKKQGRKDKAEEKYKMCIKIHSAFADAVAEALKGIFNQNDCFQCVFSPYEADAQLVKLCRDGHTDAIITEDSDVVVYCAVCHLPTPVIFKLDRRTGICDIVKIDWLLYGKPSKGKDESQKKTTALESICNSFAHRQRMKPGHGVRLFVQACILAGSDYSPNKLTGVGLVTAFKLMRENAHRNCDERFRRVLKSLSTKNRRNEDMDIYEKNLTQSEAVFYLHPVLDISTEKVTTLTTPKFSRTLAGEKTDFSPLLERFCGDITFIGKVDINCINNLSQGAADYSPNTRVTDFSLEEIVLKTEKKRKRNQLEYCGIQHGDVFNNEKQEIVKTRNPYQNKSKGKPLKDSTNKTNTKNPFVSFFYKPMDSKKDGVPSMSSFGNTRSDLRFTKRKFDKNGKPVFNPKMKMSIHDIIQKSQPAAKNTNFKSFSHADEIENNVETWNPESDSSRDIVLGLNVRGDNSGLLRSDNIEDRSDSKMAMQSMKARISTKEDVPNVENNISVCDEKPTFLLDEDESLSESDEPNDFPFQEQNKNNNRKPTNSKGLAKSKYFSQYTTSARRVTLDPPEATVNELEEPMINGLEDINSPMSATTEFKNVGTYVDVRTVAPSPLERRASSPGNSSVISEIIEIQAPLAIEKSPSLGKSACDGVSSTKSWSAKTPFQNNFNPVRQKNTRPSSKRGKQTTLFDAWSGCSYTSSTSQRREVTSRRPKLQTNKITHHFYSSVVEDSFASEKDDDFMGL